MTTLEMTTAALLTGAIIFLWGTVLGIGSYVSAGVLGTVACGLSLLLVTHARHKRK